VNAEAMMPDVLALLEVTVPLCKAKALIVGGTYLIILVYAVAGIPVAMVAAKRYVNI
jgi:hypothetical protein